MSDEAETAPRLVATVRPAVLAVPTAARPQYLVAQASLLPS